MSTAKETSTAKDLDEAVLAALFANNGVAVAPEEIAPVTGALTRINAAARALLRPSFDDTTEAYVHLLEQDDAGAQA
jgi:aspartate/methionine/tyrosine aminotransferase